MYKAVDFYLEKRKTRQYVGRLSKEKANFVFEYNMAYLRSNNPIALGPDLPVSKTKHKALKLFPSFVDRLPSKKNPAYKEYCHSVGVSPLETNPFVLLAKLGKKGPSSFVCEPVEEEKTLSSESLKQFRKNLQLSIREFADLFDVSPSTIYRIENNKTTGKDTLKKINIYLKSPKTVLDKIKQTGGGKLHENKQHLVKKFFESQAVTELYAILNEFTEPDFSIENKIGWKINSFIKEKVGDVHLPKNSPLLYEQTAFSLIETWQPDKSTPGWEGLHYGPILSVVDSKTGKLISDPDIKDITPQMINYWEKRSNEVKNPILQYRYAGLVWDFSQKIRNKKPNIALAQRFIDSAIWQAKQDKKGSHIQKKLERALRLAVSIKEIDRILYLRDTLIKYEKTHSEDEKPSTWGYLFDLLIGDKKLSQKIPLKKEQEQHIIKELERRLKAFFNKKLKKSKPHNVEYIITKLAPYYKSKNDTKNMHRVLLTYRDAFLFGPLPVIGGDSLLRKVEQILRQYGLAEETKNLERIIRDLQKASVKELKPMSVTVPLPRKEIESYISTLDKSDLPTALSIISTNFIPDKIQAKETALEVSKKHPLSFLVSQQIMDHTGRKVTEVGSLKDDLEGHIVRQMSNAISFNQIFIEMGLSHLQKNKALNADTLSEHLFKSPVFSAEHHKIIKEGLTAFFDEHYIVSCSSLMLQIESAIRCLISANGGQIYQPAGSNKEKGFELKPLGALIRDKIFTRVFSSHNKNVPYYFQVLLTDKRGWNLRNMICHGHFPSTNFNRNVTVCIIHALLILSLIKKK